MTENQQKCLDVIAEFMRANRGVSPSYQEIADLMGFSVKSMAHRLVETLVRDGHVTTSPKFKRSIQLVKTPWTAVGEAAEKVLGSIISEHIDETTVKGTIRLDAEAIGELDVAMAELKGAGIWTPK